MSSEYDTDRINRLLNFQMDLFTRMKKARVNYAKSPKDRITKEYLDGRLESLDQLWFEFLAGHKELMRNVNTKVMLATEYIGKEVYDEAEEIYAQYKCELKTKITLFCVGSATNAPSMDTQMRSSNVDKCQVQLPKINIPIFSGLYSEWCTFRDLFKSLIHTNVSLDNVQKLHYLKGYLSGEAEQLLRHIPISAVNYDRCWKLLAERYNNKKYLCHNTLKRLFSQRNIVNESANSLKELIDTTNDCLSSLQNLGIQVESWDVVIIHILTLKLDPESRRQMEFSVTNNNSSDELPTYKQLKEFITNRYRAIEFLDPRSVIRNQGHQQWPKGQGSTVNKIQTHHVTNVKCTFCSEQHTLGSCKDFGKRSVESRRDFVMTNNICFNCLGVNHSAKACTVKLRCRVCKRKHHSLLHPDIKSDSKDKDAHNLDGTNTKNNKLDTSASVVSCYSSGEVYKSGQVLLATAVVSATSGRGNRHLLRALLDQGSQSSFVTEDTVQSLGLKKIPVNGQISGLGGNKTVNSKAIVFIKVHSRIDPNFVINVKAHVLRSITSLLPSNKMQLLDWAELKDLELADPEYHTPSRIDLLLGAEVYGTILRDGVKRSPFGSPIAQSTKLGWVLSGAVIKTTSGSESIRVLHCRTDDNDLLRKFWEIESDIKLPREQLYTADEKRCEDFYNKTTCRDSDGRYVVCLPCKADNPQVSNSYAIAERRLKSLENRLKKDEDLKTKYKEVLAEYLQLNHMELVPENEINSIKAIYLPHHAVVRNDKDTTKVRVVYDASQKGSNGMSLNDNLLVGPTLQSDLRHLIIRWRSHPICLTADLIKMYRQVRVSPKDVDLQRILWREDPRSEIKHYRLLTVTFGTSCAPYLAVKSLHRVAQDEGQNFPLAAGRVIKDFYMDDLLTGCQSKGEAISLYREMNELLKKAGFETQKWTSNCNEVVNEIKCIESKGINSQVQETENLKIKTDEIVKIVGLIWNRNDDSFRYVVNIPELPRPVTKRTIISNICRLYDPLGWVAPCIIVSKIIIQKLWLAGLGWDEAVPDNLLEEWVSYREELKRLCEVRIPRWMSTTMTDRHVELHGFSDASKAAYAAVVYARVIDTEGRIHVALISAKTKVAPVKQVSIPRLELCGAVLLVRLMMEMSTTLNAGKPNLHAWCDSTVVLAWLNSHPSRWKVFVANRVSEILTSLDSHHWCHISSGENAADSASRGQQPSEFVKSDMWFSGPEFLHEPTIKYEKTEIAATELEVAKVHHVTVNEVFWDKYSSLTRLTRVVAYCRRFVHNSRRQMADRFKGYLSSKELLDALNLCIKQCQMEHFSEEIHFIKKKENLPKGSSIRPLNPIVDNDDILRVGGRLEHSTLSFSRKHPIIIPKKSHLTELIITDAHKQTLHGGPQLMLSYLQAKYWILSAKQLVKTHFRRCVICIKNSPPKASQLMGQLPTSRVTPNRAFKCSGVDYAGPIQIRTSKGRGNKSHKGYICLFVCMVTRAIHLEAVTDLTSEGFMQAFKRFVSRRGYCSDLWSDNGTNFVGAASELKRLFADEQNSMVNEVAEALSTNGCQWHFIPAQSPNFGGLWEAGVKSVKYHIKRIIGQSTLTFEEISTVLAQIEACLNSRPQMVLNSNDDGFTVLTPGHFVVGEPLVTPPDRNYETSNVGSLRRWQYTQRMLQDFWRLWSREYLTKYYNRYRWSGQTPQPKLDDIVVVKEDSLPPCRWLYGRVIATHPGADSIVRVVTLKTKSGTMKRPVSKLCLLPVTDTSLVNN